MYGCRWRGDRFPEKIGFIHIYRISLIYVWASSLPFLIKRVIIYIKKLADVDGGAIAFLEVQRLASSLWPGHVGFFWKFESWRVPCSLVALGM